MPKYTEKQLTDAAKDAKQLLKDSAIVLQAFSAMIVAMRLFAVSRSVLHSELAYGWTVANQDVVEFALSQMANQQALVNYTNAELLADLQNSTLPYMQAVAANEANPEETTEDAPKQTLGPTSPDPGPPDSCAG